MSWAGYPQRTIMDSTPPAEVGLSPAAYLEAALDIIQQEAVRSSAVDWPTLRTEVHHLAAHASTPADTYPAIERVLAALGDHHSFLMRPKQSYASTPGGFGLKYLRGVIARIYANSPAARAGLQVGDQVLTVNGMLVGEGINRELPRQGDAVLIVQTSRAKEIQTVHLSRATFTLNRLPKGRILHPGVGWLDLPDHGGDGTLPDGRLYQDVVRDLIAQLHAAGATRWIVDLRLNEGGNMYPMLAGIGPLAGEGILGAFVKDDVSWPWAYKAGEASVDGHVNTRVTGAPYPTLPAETPVAVLLSPLTSSSGEIVAISFKGRPCTRFFGEATQGLTSANSPFPLADGAEIWLATSYEADRTGRHYQTVVKPDVEVLTDWRKYLSDEDAVLRVGVDWLTTQLSSSAP